MSQVILQTDFWFWVLAVIGPVLMIMVPLLANFVMLIRLTRKVTTLTAVVELLVALQHAEQ